MIDVMNNGKMDGIPCKYRTEVYVISVFRHVVTFFALNEILMKHFSY